MDDLTGELVHIPVWDDGKIVAYAIVDPIDAGQAAFEWSLHRRYVIRYAGHGPGRTILMHRAILGLVPGDGLQGDHVNRNRLDNRRSNLRVATNAQNAQNRGSLVGSSSRFRGVTWHRAAGKWVARAKLDGRSIHLGLFVDEQEAAAVAAEYRAAHMPYAVD